MVDPAIASRVGISARSVIRIRQRLGLPGWPKGKQLQQFRRYV